MELSHLDRKYRPYPAFMPKEHGEKRRANLPGLAGEINGERRRGSGFELDVLPVEVYLWKYVGDLPLTSSHLIKPQPPTKSNHAPGLSVVPATLLQLAAKITK